MENKLFQHSFLSPRCLFDPSPYTSLGPCDPSVRCGLSQRSPSSSAFIRHHGDAPVRSSSRNHRTRSFPSLPDHHLSFCDGKCELHLETLPDLLRPFSVSPYECTACLDPSASSYSHRHVVLELAPLHECLAGQGAHVAGIVPQGHSSII